MSESIQLNIPTIDAKHDEFLELLEKIKKADKNSFHTLFQEMIEHTKEHFSYEESLMDKYEFYGKSEHIEEHHKLLEEMEYFYEKSQKMMMFGKSYINDYAHEKFYRHIINIDSQFAMFLKGKNISL